MLSNKQEHPFARMTYFLFKVLNVPFRNKGKWIFIFMQLEFYCFFLRWIVFKFDYSVRIIYSLHFCGNHSKKLIAGCHTYGRRP